MQFNTTIRRKDKGYQCIVSYKEGNKWRQKSKQGFPTQKEAKIHAQKIIDALKKTITYSLDDSLKDITLIEFYDIYIRDNAPKTFNTLRTYKNSFNLFKPLHNEKLATITPYQVKRLLTELPYSASSKKLGIRFN